MLIRRARKLAITLGLPLALMFLIACGTAANPATTTEDTTTQSATSQDSMSSDSTDKSSKSMAADSMDKSSESMSTDSMDKSSESMGQSMVQSMGTLTLDISGLSPLANGFHYEGWAIINGSPATTGKFNVDASGRLVDLSGSPIPSAGFNSDAALGDALAARRAVREGGLQVP